MSIVISTYSSKRRNSTNDKWQNSLPETVLCHILGYISPVCGILSLRVICKRWDLLIVKSSHNSKLWENVYFDSMNIAQMEGFVKFMTERGNMIRYLSLYKCLGISYNCIVNIPMFAPHIRVIDISGVYDIPPNVFKCLLTQTSIRLQHNAVFLTFTRLVKQLNKVMAHSNSSFIISDDVRIQVNPSLWLNDRGFLNFLCDIGLPKIEAYLLDLHTDNNELEIRWVRNVFDQGSGSLICSLH